jgi:ParB-like chromosome segregation protein Spo0J
MEFHPLANLFLMMSARGIKRLAEDIKENGQIHPISTVRRNGKQLIIDGRARNEACP